MGPNYEHVGNVCSLEDFEYVQQAVRLAGPRLKTYASFGNSYADSIITTAELEPEMVKEELVSYSVACINNKISNSARAIWWCVNPPPLDDTDCEVPIIFCTLFHHGQWMYLCNFEDFEREFSVARELRILQVAAAMPQGEPLGEERAAALGA